MTTILQVYLAYSPEISDEFLIVTIKDSSEPFRAFSMPFYQLSSDVPVERSAYSSDMELDIIEDDSSLRGDENGESELIVRSSVPWCRYLLLGLLIYSLRLLRLPLIRLNTSKDGHTSAAYRTTRSLSLSALRAETSAPYGLPAF